MNNEKNKRYKITFDFEYLDDILEVLKQYNVIHQSFSDTVSIICELPKESEQFILYKLLIITFKQIKITDLTFKDEEFRPEDQGTDKPLGSKSAIDEN